MMKQFQMLMSGKNGDDILRTIFDIIIENEKNFNDDILPKDDPVKFFTMISAMIVEAGEALQEDKRWKILVGNKREYEKNDDKQLEELADVFIYGIAAILYANFDYDMFIEAVLQKLQIVHEISLEGAKL